MHLSAYFGIRAGLKGFKMVILLPVPFVLVFLLLYATPIDRQERVNFLTHFLLFVFICCTVIFILGLLLGSSPLCLGLPLSLPFESRLEKTLPYNIFNIAHDLSSVTL
jgi:hypothetical protein